MSFWNNVQRKLSDFVSEMTSVFGRIKITSKFVWYDFRVGLYYDRAHGTLYICPLPMWVIKIRFLSPAEVINSKW